MRMITSSRHCPLICLLPMHGTKVFVASIFNKLQAAGLFLEGSTV